MTQQLITSPLARLLRIGATAGRVGTSLAAERALSFWLADPVAQARSSHNLVLNAIRVSEALGELKGAAMKVGQMLSVHEGMLPAEVCEVLRRLQSQAAPVAFEQMRTVLDGEIPGGLRRFELFEPVPLASASIGQVYRGRLADGRWVAVKVQYPDIDRIIEADLKNLKKLLGSLLAMVAEVDFEPLWAEIRERLLEELDYQQEAENIEIMARLYRDDPGVLIPGTVPELSGRRVLTLDYVPGISAEEACSSACDQTLRDRWGESMVRFTMRGLLEHRVLHADPNFGNFAFREDGSLVVYDLGCVKRVPLTTTEGCRQVLNACLEQDLRALPGKLHALGVYDRKSGAPVAPRVVEPLAREVLRVVEPRPYRFSKESRLYQTILADDGRYLSQLMRLEMPPDLVYVNRTLSGLFGNLCQLRAEARWDEILRSIVLDTRPSGQ